MFDTAAGSSHLCMIEGEYDIYVEHVSGGRVRIDYVLFTPDGTAIEPLESTTWGTIKSLYR